MSAVPSNFSKRNTTYRACITDDNGKVVYELRGNRNPAQALRDFLSQHWVASFKWENVNAMDDIQYLTIYRYWNGSNARIWVKARHGSIEYEPLESYAQSALEGC
jgi:hypothetical protein